MALIGRRGFLSLLGAAAVVPLVKFPDVVLFDPNTLHTDTAGAVTLAEMCKFVAKEMQPMLAGRSMQPPSDKYMLGDGGINHHYWVDVDPVAMGGELRKNTLSDVAKLLSMRANENGVYQFGKLPLDWATKAGGQAARVVAPSGISVRAVSCYDVLCDVQLLRFDFVGVGV